MDELNKGAVMLNALCYTLWQAMDCINVVYQGADIDEQIHFRQIKDLANEVVELHDHFLADDPKDAATLEACFNWDSSFEDIARCNTLQEYKNLNNLFK